LEEMRTDYGLEPPICWSVSITTTLPELLTLGIYDQKTILADYLKTIRQYQQHPFEPLNLLPFLPKDYRGLPFGKKLPLVLPEKLTSYPVLKRLVFGDSKKELTPTEGIQLSNLRKKIREVHRQDRQRTLKSVTKEKPENEKKKGKKRKRRFLLTAKMLRKLQIRQQQIQTILQEAAALGWDMLTDGGKMRNEK